MVSRASCYPGAVSGAKVMPLQPRGKPASTGKSGPWTSGACINVSFVGLWEH